MTSSRGIPLEFTTGSWNLQRMRADIRLRAFRSESRWLFGIHAGSARPCRQNLTHGQLNADFERVLDVAMRIPTLGFCTSKPFGKLATSLDEQSPVKAMKNYATDRLLRAVRTRLNVSLIDDTLTGFHRVRKHEMRVCANNVMREGVS